MKRFPLQIHTAQVGQIQSQCHHGHVHPSKVLRSSADILRLIDETLEQADTRLHRVGGLVALAGPGSFTGLRVGLATVLGLHQALGIPATTLSNLEVLAFSGGGDRELRLGAVDALRGEWFVQPFEGRASFRPAAEPVCGSKTTIPSPR